MYMCLGALFATVDMAVISFAHDHGGASLAGPLLGLYGVGSAIAGIWYGARHWRSSQSTRLLAALAATVLGTAPLALMPGIWSMAVAILIAGLGISATLISSHSIALAVVPAEHRTEGLTWLTTAASAGTALGAPLSGRLIDAYGPGAGFLFAFGAGLLALTVTVLRRRCLTA
ncbi:MFS transporter [Streptomyces sp. NPDC005408]|uniref:MFS transporter n=1 Tax=Streptomyces sp. NPDC005408 TaxID=3155341 RepID=UPI0033B34E5A